MRIAVLSLILFASVPSIVTACEGECIVGITKAFLTNYTCPIEQVVHDMNNEMMAYIHPDRRYSSPPKFFMGPLLSVYHNNAYSRLETAIFPSYFHGKCQQPDPVNPNGPYVNPPGCPNPDCPVVCGTPGSLVHFYPRLRYIAYNETRCHLQDLATPGSKVYAEIERSFVREAVGSGAHERRKDQVMALGGTMMPRIRRKEDAVRNQFRSTMRQLSPRMEKACGGTGTGALNGLQKCSWETRMKEFILSYP